MERVHSREKNEISFRPTSDSRDAQCHPSSRRCLLSYETGVEKPGSRAYEILLEKLRCPAADIVFIDALAENIEVALKMGLDAILFESPPSDPRGASGKRPSLEVYPTGASGKKPPTLDSHI
jgi:FMN phosphatase YigB (HAD superfamily)